MAHEAGHTEETTTTEESPGRWTEFLNYLKGVDWGDAASTGAAWKMWEKTREALAGFATSAQEGAEDIGAKAADWASFLPFTVTSGAGTAEARMGTGDATYYTQADVDAGPLPPGAAIGDLKSEAYIPGVSLNLTDEQKKFKKFFDDLTSGLMTGYTSEYAGDDWRETKEQNVYDRIMAAQAPQRERDRMNLESRLLGQGRLGVRTDMFGGTPEQLALAKAQEEQSSQDWITAALRASTEQQEDFGMLGQSLGMSYAPDQFLLSTLAPGINIASIADLGRRQGAGFLAETGMAGLDAATQAHLGRGNMTGQLMNALLAPRGESGSSLFGSLIESGGEGIWEFVKGLFGGDDD